MGYFSDYGKELIFFTVDAIIFTIAWRWHGNNRKAQDALLGPILEDNKSIEDWIKNSPTKSWAVIQGYVEPLGPVIQSTSDKSIKGVIQRLTLKEFVTARNASGFWQDGERIISNTVKTVPFGLRVGRSLVQVENAVNSNLLTLQPVRTEFIQINPSFTDYIWSFIIGTRQRGVQTTEEMLLCGTKLTGIGELMKGKDKFLSRAPSEVLLQPHCLSELTVPELNKQLHSQMRWSSALLLVASITGIGIIVYVARKLYKEHKKKVDVPENKKRYQGSRQAIDGEPTCVICDNRREVILLPCGHICLCSDCSCKIERICPICRARVHTINEYFIT